MDLARPIRRPNRLQLPVFFADEQRLRYEEFKAQAAARLVQIAQRRPLTQQEFERLQKLLACMRILCDTPFILDPTCRISPKLEELERVLSELFAESDRKVIVFSEWERMLSLVREWRRTLALNLLGTPDLCRRTAAARR